jgi:hypothetical protein
MLKLLERNIASIERRLVLLAPPSSSIGPFFRNIHTDEAYHQALVHELQRLRGSIYLEDGALERQQLSSGGLHVTPEDEKSWHMLFLNGSRVNACVWYLQHDCDVTLERLRVRNCPLMHVHPLRGTLERAIENELSRAQRAGLHYAEVGGWAVSPQSRCTSEGLLLALAAYSLGRIAGGALGMTTATVRHSSSTILRRIGGRPLEADGVTVPSYYDPKYGCDMELLRFDSREPSSKYAPFIAQIERRLADVRVIASPVPLTAGAFPASKPEHLAA